MGRARTLWNVPDMPSNDDLLDEARLGQLERAEAERLLRGRHREMYRNHLLIAHWITGWRERSAVSEHSAPDELGRAGDEAIGAIVRRLRQGAFLPDGNLMLEELKRLRGLRD